MADQESEPVCSVAEGRLLLRDVTNAVARGRNQEAARLLVQRASEGRIPRRHQMAKWLVSILGQQVTTRLIEAFVHFPCFYCKKGRLQCEMCSGRGHFGGQGPCGRCLGMGIERCDFCDGAGWVTVNYIPEGLRPLVIRKRMQLAIERIAEALKQPVPSPSARNHASITRKCYLLLLRLDRPMGVFENAVVAVKHMPGTYGPAVGKLSDLIDTCARLANEAEDKIRDTLRCLGGTYRLVAGQCGREVRKRAEETASFFELMLDPASTFAGTSLEHPFLHQAIIERVSRSSAKTSRKHKTRAPRGE